MLRTNGSRNNSSVYSRLSLYSVATVIDHFTKQIRGLAKPCVTTDLISRFDDEMIDSSRDRREYIIKSISGTMYAGTCHSLVEPLVGGVPIFV